MAEEVDWARMDGRERLAEVVKARRAFLGLTQEEVAGRAGPSSATIRLIEGALQAEYRSRTLGQLDLSLEWDSWTCRSIFGYEASGDENDEAFNRLMERRIKERVFVDEGVKSGASGARSAQPGSVGPIRQRVEDFGVGTDEVKIAKYMSVSSREDYAKMSADELTRTIAERSAIYAEDLALAAQVLAEKRDGGTRGESGI